MTGNGDRDRDELRIPETVFGALEIREPARIALFLACAALALGLALVAYDGGLATAPSRALFILVLAALLWVTEAIPGFGVSLLVIGLQIALLGRPQGAFATTPTDWERFVVVIGHPLVWLFFGGFVLAAGMARTGLDRRLAASVLGRFGERPARVLLGVMAVTFGLSMFISNTATTAMMLAMLGPHLRSLGPRDRLATALVVGTAAAANLGGMGSLIGTPPNAIAVGVLARVEGAPQISFLAWIAIGLPPALALAAATWALLVRLYPSERDRVELRIDEGDAGERAPRWQEVVVTGTLVATVALWLTNAWHGIPTAAVSLLPVVAFTTTGILGVQGFRGLSWDVLFLLAGGLALGRMVMDTGLDGWLVALAPLEGLGVFSLSLALGVLTVLVSNFMSNTGAANILVPIAVSMAAGAEARLALPVALCASAAMCLPVATPPNALVYASGRCEARDFLRVGIPLAVVTPLLAALWSPLALAWIG